jgi:hypothetical protein
VQAGGGVVTLGSNLGMKYLLLLPLTLVLGGCATSAATSRPAPPISAARTAPSSTDVAPTQAPPATAAKDHVLASRPGMLDGEPVRLAITQLERAGSTTSLGIRLTTYSGWSVKVSNSLDDGDTEPISNSNSRANGFSLDGIYLIERTQAEKYLVARDPDNRCICDAGLEQTSFNTGAPLNLSATYGAPPPDVQAIDVVVPRFGIFANVPLG